jgi:hypothetical protein
VIVPGQQPDSSRVLVLTTIKATMPMGEFKIGLNIPEIQKDIAPTRKPVSKD